MKLRNKKTGEIGELHFEPDKEYHFTVATEDPADMRIYKTLTDLNEEWEDYEEPETFWGIMSNGGITEREITSDEIRQEFIEDSKAIGNYFETREEAEKAVEKLKAWKRLKQGGFHWNSWTLGGAHFGVDLYDGYNNDLDLVFGGEE